MSNIDTSKPNISRVYDYVLGGNHNFEADRAMAQQLMKLLPSYPVWARLNRWFLQLVAQRWSEEQFANILDLASGMPTQDHFHSVASKARVLYSDNDPITVVYGREVIGDDPRVLYIEGDIRNMPPILQAADSHFAGERLAAIGAIGIAYLLPDDIIGPMLQSLHDWAAPGSVLAVSFASSSAPPEVMEVAIAGFGRLGMVPTLRTIDEFSALAAPWQLQEVRPLSEWVGVEKEFAPDDILAHSVEMYGALFKRLG
jgi:hypothetical protein